MPKMMLWIPDDEATVVMQGIRCTAAAVRMSRPSGFSPKFATEGGADGPGERVWVSLDVEGGDVLAQASLGQRYYRGDGVRRDYAEAARWTRRAAECRVHVDRDLVEQALYGLLTNAVDASPAGGAIRTAALSMVRSARPGSSAGRPSPAAE